MYFEEISKRVAINEKKMIICMIVLVTVGAFFACKSILKYYEQKSYVETMKPTIEQYICLNFSKVKSIEYDEIVATPMAPLVNGHTNKNKDLDFSVIIGDNKVYGLGYGSALIKYEIENGPRVLKKIK